jgi:VWFA-related protein
MLRLGLAASFSLLTAQPPLVFPTSAELVYVVASVTDGSGQPVRGLKAKDFTVREDGKAREVTTFASFADVPGGAGAEWPVDFVLLLDTSGSMREDLRRARDAAVEFAGSIPSVRGRNIVSFNSKIRVWPYEETGRGSGSNPRGR